MKAWPTPLADSKETTTPTRVPRPHPSVSAERQGRGRLLTPLTVYAATWPLRLKNASNSVLTMSFRIEHMPCGAPGTTLSIAPLTSFEEIIAEAPMGTQSDRHPHAG